MGEIVLAAKMTHVPTMLMSEQDGPVKGKRQAAIDGHREIARRAKELGADTVVICDTHWVINAGFHINANSRFEGLFTSNEFPQFIQNLPYAYDGNPGLGDAIAAGNSDSEKAPSSEMQAAMNEIMQAVADVYDRMSADVRFTARGVEIDTSVTLKD